ncbi:MAG: hypothetical protein QW084_03830 [Candidatus Hadarchaeales archaeon]
MGGEGTEDLCAWLVVLLLLSSFLHSLFSFWGNLAEEPGEEVRRTERALSRLSGEPCLLEDLGRVEPGMGVWREGEKLAGGEKPPGTRTVMLPAALRKGFSVLLVEVEAWE